MTPNDLNPKGHDLTLFQAQKLKELADTISKIEEAYGGGFTVTSGFRTEEDQLRINPKNPRSAHRTGEAVDVLDLDGRIYDFCIDNLGLIIELGVYLECKTYTRRWCHMQIKAPKSGNRIFIP